MNLATKSDYVELRCRSAFSFLDGASLPEELVAAAAARGHDTLALADPNGVYGAPRFFAAARRAGIRPIVGAELALVADAHGGAPPPVLLLVEDRRGYQNLTRLLTRAWAGRRKEQGPVAPPRRSAARRRRRSDRRARACRVRARRPP